MYSQSVNEEYTNKLIQINIPTTTNGQSTGAKGTKIVDLLRITHQFVIRAFLTNESTKTAKEIKEELFKIATGAEQNGGVITMTYDGDTLTGYIEKIVCTKTADDSSATTSDQVRKYELSITFIVGVSTSS